MAEISLGDVDIEAVLFRLTRHAQGLFGAFRCMGLEPLDVAYAGGDGPEDLAMNLLLRFLDPQGHSVRWSENRGRPSTDGVYALLRKALDNDFLDLKKSKRYTTTVYLEAEDRGDDRREITLEQLAIYWETPEGALLMRERRERIIMEFSDDPEAQEIVKLQLDRTKSMSKPKRQHWVPCFYLRHFATPETRASREPKVWVLSKHEGDPMLTSIRNVALQRYLYSPQDESGKRLWDMESKFADYESLMQRVWPQLADGMVDLYEPAMRKGLALFISLLYLRHPRRLAEVARLHARLVQMMDDGPKDARGNPDLAGMEINGVFWPLRDNTDWPRYRDASADDKKRMFLDGVRANATYLAEIMMNKRWSVVFTEEPVFITTDTPVTLLHRSREVFGFGTPGVVISFPLSPTRVLMMDERHEQPKGHYYPLKGSPADHNGLAWRDCERFMISPRHTDLVCRELLASAALHGDAAGPVQ